jgi:tetratricopeptide (TPR) repeat protein
MSILDKLDKGHVFEAYQEALEGLEKDPNDHLLRQYAALALLKTGAVMEAKAMIEPVLNTLSNLDDLKNNNPDFLALMAKILKQTWRYSRYEDDLNRACELYKQHFNLCTPETTNVESYLASGVEASSLSWLAGNDADCLSYATRVIQLGDKISHEKSQKSNADDDLKLFLTLGEAYMLSGQHDMAEAMFKRTKQSTMAIVDQLHQLKFLYENGYLIPKSFFDILTPPKIVVFTGQMIDPPGRKPERFFHNMEEFVKQAIVEKLNHINVQIGYTMASCGSDLLFIEAMLERGAEVHIVLPFNQDDFIKHNISPGGPRWEARFKKALEKASSVQFATKERFLGHETLYRFANMVLHGMAEMRGNFLLSPPHLLAVWDSQPDTLIGGAADFIDQWGDITTLHIVDLDTIKTQCIEKGLNRTVPLHMQSIRIPFHKDEAFEEDKKVQRIIKNMLFADMAGFSKLQEEHIPPFLNFLKELDTRLKERAPKPLSINTWGDGIFVVMDDATELADYALWLSELVPEVSKSIKGLPPMQVRISLHAGPVYQAHDPFREQTNFYGGHINRAARLEPVTVVGQVYGTEQFMALLTREQGQNRIECHQSERVYVERFAYEYIGVVELAKSFGKQPVYHIRWI